VVGGLRQSDAQANGQSTKTTQEAKAGNSQWLTLPPTPTLPGTPRKGIATINGTNIFYAQFGQGRPVLLLHGGLANSNYWGHQVEYLAESFSVIVMDTRGHGRSSVMSPSFSYSLFAEDTVGLLDFLGNFSSRNRRLERRRRHRTTTCHDEAYQSVETICIRRKQLCRRTQGKRRSKPHFCDICPPLPH
jgi:hypothetical protein